MDSYITGTGQQLDNVHSPVECKGNHCVIHNPSNHHMVGWPTHWRHDRRLMERLCPCGIGHPDPDDINYYIGKDGDDHYRSIHGCCGHCSPPGDERESNP